MKSLTVTVNQTNLPVKEYRGQRVVTLKEIDEVHERPTGTAKRNFIENKEHLINGIDYFELTTSQKNEIRTLEIPNRGITVLTESGYLMLVKSFTDDLAWDVQRALVNSYFRAGKSADMTEYQRNMMKTRADNVRIRRAQLLERIAGDYDGTYKQVLQAYATKELTGEFLLPLPKLERETYSATEIGERLGISANKVGSLAKAHNLKTDEYGAWYVDKSPHSCKEVKAFRYYETVLPVLSDLLGANRQV